MPTEQKCQCDHRKGGAPCTGVPIEKRKSDYIPLLKMLYCISHHLGKKSRLFSKTLQSLVSQAPVRVFFKCHLQSLSLHPCCSLAWNSLPPDGRTAVPSHLCHLTTEVSAQVPPPESPSKTILSKQGSPSSTPGGTNLP